MIPWNILFLDFGFAEELDGGSDTMPIRCLNDLLVVFATEKDTNHFCVVECVYISGNYN